MPPVTSVACTHLVVQGLRLHGLPANLRRLGRFNGDCLSLVGFQLDVRLDGNMFHRRMSGTGPEERKEYGDGFTPLNQSEIVAEAVLELRDLDGLHHAILPPAGCIT
jgi:hypothetical protein